VYAAKFATAQSAYAASPAARPADLRLLPLFIVSFVHSSETTLQAGKLTCQHPCPPYWVLEIQEVIG
jgi:hypothetical protein